MNELRLMVNRQFYLGLFDYECHYAKYEHSDFYKKHLDAFKGRSNRVLSTVSYLNTPAQGGELIIYHQESTEVAAKVIRKASTFGGIRK